MKIKCDALILDIDGTIWNTTGVVATAWNRAIDLCALDAQKVTAAMLQKEFGKPMNVIADDLWPNLSQAQKDSLMEKCCQQEQIALSQNTSDITFPGVVQTIRALKERFNIYIVSNCQSGYIELTMQKNKIEDCIKDSECYGNTKKYKAQNLSLLIERNSIKMPVYVGDTQGDADACKEAGVPFIFAEYGFGQAKGYNAKIKNFAELQNILQAASQG